VAPEFRSGLGRTKSGRVMASLGDTSVAYDPLAAQGAQSSLIQAAIYVDRIVDYRGPFDEHWINESYETYYAQRAAAGELVTRLFLGHPDVAAIGHTLISAAHGSERFAGQFFGLSRRRNRC
jgi:hypothetical protein